MVRNARIPIPDTESNSGRPSKFTKERRAKIVHAISRRAPYEMAAEASGISVATLYDWLHTGRSHQSQDVDSDYSKFLEDIKKVELDRVVEHTNMIADAADRWQGHAWILERRWPKHFGSNVLLKELDERMTKMESTRQKDE